MSFGIYEDREVASGPDGDGHDWLLKGASPCSLRLLPKHSHPINFLERIADVIERAKLIHCPLAWRPRMVIVHDDKTTRRDLVVQSSEGIYSGPRISDQAIR